MIRSSFLILLLVAFCSKLEAGTLRGVTLGRFQQSLDALVVSVNARDLDAVYQQASQWFRSSISLNELKQKWPHTFHYESAKVVYFDQREKSAYTIVHVQSELKWKPSNLPGHKDLGRRDDHLYVIFWDLEPDGWHFNNLFLGSLTVPSKLPAALETGFLNAEQDREN